jgi:CD63 antigen
MGLSCGASVVKYGIFIFNLLCAVAGIALIVVGAIPLFKLDDIREAFPENEPAIVPIIVVCLGSIIFLISFFGCCGAIRENQCMVSTYAFCLLVLVILQIVVAVFAFMYTADLANAAKDGFGRLFDDRNNPSTGAAIDQIQRGLQCCGTTGPLSWGLSVPQSCCADGTTSCNLLNAHQTGCSTMLADIVNGSGLLIAWFAIIFAGIELVGVIFACCLANSIRNADRRQYA